MHKGGKEIIYYTKALFMHVYLETFAHLVMIMFKMLIKESVNPYGIKYCRADSTARKLNLEFK